MTDDLIAERRRRQLTAAAATISVAVGAAVAYALTGPHTAVLL